MGDKRGLLGGLCLVVGAAPLALFYGMSPVGYLGLGLVAIGLLVVYGSFQVESSV